MTYSQKCNGSTFLDLPTEILLEIIKSSADLSSLCSLIAASFTVASIFDTSADEIINAVVTATAVPKQIQVLMRAVIMIQTCSFECKNLDEAISGLSFKNLKPLNHDRNVPPKQFRNLVNLAHKIHSLAHYCLNHYIQKCMGLEPSRPIDPKFYYGCCGMPMGSTESERYQLKDLGPPSWLEEQRVIRILWIMQVFFELRIALNEGRLDHWSEEDKSKLEDMHATDFHEPLELFGGGLILTMVDFFEELQAKRHRQDDAASIH